MTDDSIRCIVGEKEAYMRDNPLRVSDTQLSINLTALEELPKKDKAKMLCALVPGEILSDFIASLVCSSEEAARIQAELDIDYSLWTYTTDSLRGRLQPMLEPAFREECETLRRIAKNNEEAHRRDFNVGCSGSLMCSHLDDPQSCSAHRMSLFNAIAASVKHHNATVGQGRDADLTVHDIINAIAKPWQDENERLRSEIRDLRSDAMKEAN